MADAFAGCLFERLPGPRALASVPFVEFAPRTPLPTLATLARLRKQASGWPRLALVAPRSSWSTPRGPMRPGPELDAGLEWIRRVSDILSAFAIVLATGAELTTGERDRELLASVVERLKPTGRTIVVAPRGLWEPEHAVPFAAKIGAVYGFDPLEHDAPPGPITYGRVRPMGARPRLTEGHLAQIAERIASARSEQAYVSIESEQCAREVKRLTKQMAEALLTLDDDSEDDDSEDALDLDSEDDDSEDALDDDSEDDDEDDSEDALDDDSEDDDEDDSEDALDDDGDDEDSEDEDSDDALDDDSDDEDSDDEDSEDEKPKGD